MTNIFREIKFGTRSLLKTPGYTIVVILTLTLGVGANVALFSVVDTVVLRPLPFPDSDRLVKVTFSNPGVALKDIPFSYPEFEDIRSKSGALEDVSVVWPSNGNLTGAKEPVALELLAVSPNYFSMLGAIPQVGRLFGTEDNADGFSQTAVISDGLWHRSYGADQGVIGRALQIDGDPYTIVGVAPKNFRHPGRTVDGDIEVWLAAGFKADPFSPSRSQREIPGAIARLKQGMTVTQARARLSSLAAQIQRDFPSDYPKESKWSIELIPLQQALVANLRPTLFALFAASSLILLLACVNIANLLIARAAAKRQETAVKIALGAARGRLLIGSFVESGILSLVSTICGTIAAALGLHTITRLVPSTLLPQLNALQLDWSALAFATLLSVATSVIFGLLPAIQTVKLNHFAAIREGTKGSGQSRSTNNLRGLLIISEVSLALVLMVGAGLLLKTIWSLQKEDTGFNAENVVTAGVWLPAPNDPKADKYGDVSHQATFMKSVLRNLSQISGVTAVGATSLLPASGAKATRAPIVIDGVKTRSTSDQVEVISISPDYFSVVQTPLLEGRFFRDTDDSNSQKVLITDESTAKRYWPLQDPLGKQVRITNFEGKQDLDVVVGVVKDAKQDGLDRDGVPHVYAPVYQTYGKTLNFAVRTSLPAALLEKNIRNAIQTIDPGLPVFAVRPLHETVDASLSVRRLSATLILTFAVGALLLAAIGIYGLLAYFVTQKATEIGVRMALGATRGGILSLFLRRGLILAGIGITVGMVVALTLAPALKVLLYDVTPFDPAVLIIVPLLLFSVALLASVIPALRAARVNPMVSLRQQ